MSSADTSDRAIGQVWTLPAWRPRALSVQGLVLIGAVALLPPAAHWAGVSVRSLLPMHWPVIFLGLSYGWRSGAVVGLAAPSLSYLLSGMPLPAILPAMTVELAAYGFIAGFVREPLGRGPFAAVAASLIGGRIVFVATAVATGAIALPLGEYLQAALLAGWAAALAQLLLLPPAARWWVRRERQR